MSLTSRPHQRPIGRSWTPLSRRLAGLVVGLALVLASTPGPTAQPRYDGLVVFGTSLSDSGNSYALVGGNNTPPGFWVDDLFVPFVPYARGGHHLTNGATWIEQLARPAGLAPSVQPAFRSASPIAMNFAVGTVRARPTGTSPELAQLIGAYLLKTGGVASPDALHVIEVGSNDVRDAFAVSLAGIDGSPIVTAAVTGITNGIAALYASGARQFLVWNAPDLSLTPAGLALDLQYLGAGAIAQGLTLQFNAELNTALAGLSLVLPGIQIVPLDVFTLFHDVVTAKAAYGLTDVTTPCITPDEPPFTCRQPDEFLFWDGIHPTQAGHAIVADEARTALGL
jgi:phospholipase/lecithinase/hemolysin